MVNHHPHWSLAMDTSAHHMSALFSQLGLDSSPNAMTQFIMQHRLPDHLTLTQAPFWNAGQVQFLNDCYREDSDWIPVVDELNARLHHPHE
jgi:hypothetical protein